MCVCLYLQLYCFFTHCHSSCHIVNTQLGTVSAHDSKVDTIEDESNSKLHDGVGMDGEEKTNASEDEQQDDIANYAHHICSLVDKEKPSID